ncbi:MAG: succinate dehydrogenase [Parachlamydiaceae bacterium]|nr:succinate dehydrogenase [Parachlamydiaceae bacterium]
MAEAAKIPSAFIWRRLHSLTGVFLVLYLMEHLLVNSQAALFFGSDGNGFIDSVNGIHRLPYLPVIEALLLGVPLLIHGIWGVVYLLTGKINTTGVTGSTPYLPEYPRNHAYTWQRITSWILLFAIAAHVVHMRFVEYPTSAQKGASHFYMVRLHDDPGLQTLSSRLGFTLYDEAQIQKDKAPLRSTGTDKLDNPVQKLEIQQQKDYVASLEKHPLSKGEVIAVSPDFGTATLLMLRDTFKMPVMMVLYTIFTLTACFHAFNGLWTAMITWGITMTTRSQNLMRTLSTILLCLTVFLGLAAIWGTYWFNLYN